MRLSNPIRLAIALALICLATGCGGGSGGGSNADLPIPAMIVTPTAGPAPLFVQFDGSFSSDPDGTITKWDWDFGDLTNGAGVTTDHTYTLPGNYPVRLTVTDDSGNSNTVAGVVSVGTPGPATPPVQPAIGPGGGFYPHQTVVATQAGAGATGYWLFEPADPKPASAPVVVFVHGFSAIEPSPYRAWIDHLVRRGNIVIYPVYQDLLTLPLNYTPNAVTAIQSALTLLQTGNHVAPETDKMAVAGHSFGGVIAADLAAVAALNGLPPLLAVLCAEPGTGGLGAYADYSQIPAGTLLLCVAGNDDTVVGGTDAKRIYDEAVQIGSADKDHITLLADSYGEPDLLADHNAPLAAEVLFPPNSVDWYGFWKWLDGLTDAAFYGTNRNYALGNTPEQTNMGLWSDGIAVVLPVVTDSP